MSKVMNLMEALIEATGRSQDHRFRPWAKRLERVNPNAQNGYAFEGEWVKEGTVEVEPGPALYLVKTSWGSRKYQTPYYDVIYMDADYNLTHTGISTDGKERGWALRIRDQVAEKLAEIHSAPKPVTVTIQNPDTLKALQELRERLDLDDETIIGAAIQMYLDHVRGMAG